MGSIVAIIAAAIIAAYQHWATVAREKRQRRDDAGRVERLCKAFGEQVIAGAAELARMSHARDRELVAREFSRLREVLDFGRSVKVDQIPADVVKPFMSLRAIGSEAADCAESVHTKPHIDLHSWARQFDKLRADAQKMYSEMDAAFKRAHQEFGG